MRIAPPEAPHNGYAYGKGLYFANAFTTSEGYSCGTPEKLMLLCKSAIGRLGTLAPYKTWATGNGSCIDTSKYDSCIGFASKHFKDSDY